ncbi:hypothetical protein IU433_12180 [Nocardia puris]|uniref:hypothetical protein n=1 Tax=Nocardia puris TaxID=208602 RepID=UPI001893E145|nr:hypothetical protein [Nocardia puris]MBF6459794.1 hypothetical protein [Nocardia puris]
MSNSDREVIQSVEFAAANSAPREQPEYHDTGLGMKVTDRLMKFLQHAQNGTLPDLGDIPPLDPQVQLLAEELSVVHLPEWRNPAGRKLADPTVSKIPQAPRIAAYMFERGWRHHPELEKVRWTPTPGGVPAPWDTGLHIYPDENGNWPAPDPEEYWDVEAIKTQQLDSGDWAAAHPRGIAFQARTKSEAYAGLVEKIRTKIEEAKAVKTD